MARRGSRALLVAAMVVLSVAIPSAALAAPASAGGPVDVQVWAQNGQTIIITSVAIPQSTELPTLVRIPVASGAKIEWAGEILGTDAASDISRDYKLVRGVGGTYAEFYLTTSRRAQIDSVASSLTASGSTLSMAVDWVQSVSASETLFSVRLPVGMSAVSIKPAPIGTPTENGTGDVLYVLPSKTMAPGEKTTVSLSYSTIPPVAPQPKSALNTILIGLGSVLVLAVIALLVAIRRRRS